MVDKYPCWYADLEKGDTLDEYYWRIGCVSSEKKSECIVKFVDIGDINDRSFIKKMFGAEFALKLINLYKEGGEALIVDWVNKGV